MYKSEAALGCSHLFALSGRRELGTHSAPECGKKGVSSITTSVACRSTRMRWCSTSSARKTSTAAPAGSFLAMFDAKTTSPARTPLSSTVRNSWLKSLQ